MKWYGCCRTTFIIYITPNFLLCYADNVTEDFFFKKKRIFYIFGIFSFFIWL